MQHDPCFSAQEDRMHSLHQVWFACADSHEYRGEPCVSERPHS
jgi:hypothetical protein